MTNATCISVGSSDDGFAYDLAYGLAKLDDTIAPAELSESTRRDLEELRKPPGERNAAKKSACALSDQPTLEPVQSKSHQHVVEAIYETDETRAEQFESAA
jgi:hypothetical protein